MGIWGELARKRNKNDNVLSGGTYVSVCNCQLVWSIWSFVNEKFCKWKMKFKKEDCLQVSHKAADFCTSSNQCIIQSPVHVHLQAAPCTPAPHGTPKTSCLYTSAVITALLSWKGTQIWFHTEDKKKVGSLDSHLFLFIKHRKLI